MTARFTVSEEAIGTAIQSVRAALERDYPGENPLEIDPMIGGHPFTVTDAKLVTTRFADDYQGAYLKALSDLGTLREQAAPVVRTPEQKATTAGRPSIFLVTLPKSGTVWLSQSLRLTLGLDHTATLVTPLFPKNVLWPRMLEDFAEGGMLSVSHLQPDRENIELLKAAGVSKGVLHVRDPRAALYSWARFAPQRAPKYHQMVLNTDYRTMSEAEIIDHAVDHTLPLFVKWIEDWLAVLATDPNMDYLVTRHEDLADGERFIGRICEFYGVRHPRIVLADKSEATHFRGGDNEGWKQAFTRDQAARAGAMIPPALRSRFGWVD